MYDFFSIYSLLYWYGIEPTVRHRSLSTGPTPLPKYRPRSLQINGVFTFFFHSSLIPVLTFRIKITLSVRKLPWTNIYKAILCQIFLILYDCVHDKIYIFFCEYWNLTKNYCGNYIERIQMRAIAVFENIDHIYDWFDFKNEVCSWIISNTSIASIDDE